MRARWRRGRRLIQWNKRRRYCGICISSSLIARGGEGGQFNKRGGIGGDTYASDNYMCHVILSANGAMGSEINSKGNGFAAVVSENYGDTDEDCSISLTV